MNQDEFKNGPKNPSAKLTPEQEAQVIELKKYHDIVPRRLTIEADLTISSFDEAARLLDGENPIMLICGPGNEEVIAKLWEHSRVACVCVASAGLLKTKGSWELRGYKNLVVVNPPD